MRARWTNTFTDLGWAFVAILGFVLAAWLVALACALAGRW